MFGSKRWRPVSSGGVQVGVDGLFQFFNGVFVESIGFGPFKGGRRDCEIVLGQRIVSAAGGNLALSQSNER